MEAFPESETLACMTKRLHGNSGDPAGSRLSEEESMPDNLKKGGRQKGAGSRIAK